MTTFTTRCNYYWWWWCCWLLKVWLNQISIMTTSMILTEIKFLYHITYSFVRVWPNQKAVWIMMISSTKNHSWLFVVCIRNFQKIQIQFSILVVIVEQMSLLFAIVVTYRYNRICYNSMITWFFFVFVITTKWW